MHSKEEAYKLSSPTSHKRYYDKWASKYDEEFVFAEKYKYPENIVDTFRKMGGINHSPIADIGCGTGVLGEQFIGEMVVLDGFDISSAMLLQAKKKNAYRSLIECDLSKPNALPKNHYGAVISCGTFTIGHLGPEYLTKVVDTLVEGGLGVIGINKAHFLDKNFDGEVISMKSRRKIKNVNFVEVEIYEGDSEKDFQDISNERLSTILTFNK